MGNLFHDLEKMHEAVVYDIQNSKRKKKKRKCKQRQHWSKCTNFEAEEKITKWPHNVKHLVIESKMDFNWKQTDGINAISTEKAVA